MKYKYRKRDTISKVHKRRAIDVLYDKMNFYNDKAMVIAKEICELLKKADKAQGAKLAEMFKHMMRFNDIVIDCAVKLAPYQSARLESVEVKRKVEHSFVIKAPIQMPNSKNWMEMVEKQALPPPSFERHNFSPVNLETDEVIEADYEIDNTLEAHNGRNEPAFTTSR